MELTGDNDPNAVRVYQYPTSNEAQAMQFGRCIQLKQFSGEIPLSIAQTRPDRSELYGYVDGQLKEFDIVLYPEIITGKLGDKIYFNRLEMAAERLCSALCEL